MTASSSNDPSSAPANGDSQEPKAQANGAPAATSKPAEGAIQVQTPLTQLFEAVMNALRFLHKAPGGFRQYQNLLALLGSCAVLAAGALAFLHFIVLAARTNQFSTFLMGLGCLVGSVILHYVAARFAGAGQDMLKGTTEKMASPAFMDCLGLLAVVGGLALFVVGLVHGIQLRMLGPMIGGLVFLLIGGHLALFCFNPRECLCMEASSNGSRAGQIALSILAFLYRCLLALVPVLLGLMTAGGVLWMFVSMVRSWISKGQAFGLAQAQFLQGGVFVWIGALAPIAVYFLYVLGMLSIDLCQAVLKIERNTERS